MGFSFKVAFSEFSEKKRTPKLDHTHTLSQMAEMCDEGVLEQEEDGRELVLTPITLEAAVAAADAAEAASGAMVPEFPPLSAAEMGTGSNEYRRIRVPPHRLTPLKDDWAVMMKPVVEHLLLQIRFNPKMRAVELKTSEHTTDPGAIQKGADFIQVNDF